MDRQQPEGPSTDAAEQEWLDHWRSGPRRTRWDHVPVQVGDPAPDLELVDARSGGKVQLASLWRDRPALLLFWRHFGCSCGRDRAARLQTELDGYRAHRPAIALIGQGEPERARVYARANAIPEDATVARIKRKPLTNRRNLSLAMFDHPSEDKFIFPADQDEPGFAP